ncbi:cysteine-rich VLP protein [Sporosarcina highlanderae]|uniref:Cysteine-rich VLP protein n=1 Tax=Sporosarcina highlanderae TaxID=3035916 RepID=A0ABT8JTZ3_9BACL|nr:cysteine-rich VLP protein [Sporosarcina highlanderae]MDN4608636.1 cysteine-rich VLP protein [Sporosarcina highlanderae]
MAEPIRAISKYIAANCANYDSNGLCHLETDSTGGRLCPFFAPTGKTCKYAEQAVIPGDATIEAIYNAGKTGATGDMCERCKALFERTSNRQKYCSECAAEVRRNKRIAYDAEQYQKAKSNPYI